MVMNDAPSSGEATPLLLRLLILLTVVPLIELWLLIHVGQLIGVGSTLMLVVLTGIVGAAMARHEGVRVFRRVQSELNAGRLPTDGMIDALLILVAAALLVTPGILTDIVGFVFLIAPLRRLVREYLKKRFRPDVHITHIHPTHVSKQEGLIDTEARPVNDDNPPPRPPGS
jgi:UPF0716 protein FxsA